MATIVLGQHPARLEVRLVRGDSASLLATLTDSAGVALNWPAVPSLQFADGRTKVAIVSHVASVAGSTATWALTAAQVEVIAAASEKAGEDWLSTLARITLPDTDDITGSVEYAGEVTWSDGWSSSARTQQVTFTLPGGPAGPAGAAGATGPAGPGVAAGGTTDQILAKASSTDYATKWVDAPTGGGGGAVTSVAGRTGVVVLTSSDVGLGNVNNTADSAKPVSTAQAAADATVLSSAATDATTKANAAQAAAIAASQPLDSDLTAIAALTTTAYGRAFLGLANQAALVGLLPSYQPLDGDLTSVAALTTTAYGRAFLELSNQAALVALLPSYQPLDSDLTAIAALTTTAYGRGLLALADAAALKTSLTLVKGDVGLGNVDNTADTAKPVSTAQASANAAVQAFAIQRANHTGTQAISTLSTTGTADSTTYLRGDGSWATPAGGGAARAVAWPAGTHATLNPGTFSNETRNAAFVQLMAFDLPMAQAIDRIGIQINTGAGAGHTFKLARYTQEADGSYTRAVDYGSGTSTVGDQLLTVSDTLPAGRIFIAFAQTGTGSNVATVIPSRGTHGPMRTQPSGSFGISWNSFSGTVPTTISAATSAAPDNWYGTEVRINIRTA